MNGLAALVHKRAIGMLWSAGHAPTTDERSKIRSGAWRHQPSDPWRPDSIQESACDLLESMGHAPDRSAQWDLALPEIGRITAGSAQAGHAVRLTGPWSIAPKGTIMTLSGADPSNGLTIGRGGHYMNHDGSVSLSCGGPSSFLPIDIDVLVPTSEIVRMPFWRFADLPGAGEGVDFTRPVALWEWNGDDKAFLNVNTELAA